MQIFQTKKRFEIVVNNVTNAHYFEWIRTEKIITISINDKY